MGRPRKGWIDKVKECLKKRGLDVRQVRIMIMIECTGEVCEGKCGGVPRGCTLDFDKMPQL